LWKIWTLEEGLLEATTSLQKRLFKRDEGKNTTETGSTTGSGMAVEVLTISIVSHHDKNWLLYYGASNQMCLHRN
jgi:hypothetical protein